MKHKIDKAHYCSGGFGADGECFRFGENMIDHTGCSCTREKCLSYHRKWPTPEQYKAEYGEDWPDNEAVYFLTKRSSSDVEHWGSGGESIY
jgi:hypothetical protein